MNNRLGYLLLVVLTVLSLCAGKMTIGERARKMRARSPVVKQHALPMSTTWRYETKDSEQYKVTGLPGIDFDYGELYSGNIPTGNDSSRTLFFVFSPKIGEPSKDLTVWLNGGPGCSSLEGFLQENGPFVWTWGQYNGLPNPYSWTNLTNMLWVEYPVGTGFSTGKVTADGEEAIAADFVGFFKNFQTIFGISNYQIYVTGESYAGRYVPYVSAAIIDQNNFTHFNLSGMMIYDPTIGSSDFANNVAAYPMIQKHSLFFNYNHTFLNYLEKSHEKCGYKDYIQKYLTFPPPGVQPPYNPGSATAQNPDCATWQNAWTAAFAVNPCFNEYLITGNCPILFDPLAYPTDLQYNYASFDGPYFNRTAVKRAMHAPPHVNWLECAASPVFVGGEDGSLDPIQRVLPQVIEKTGRVLIAEGDYDFSVLTDAALISIQNMTWNGKLGFQKRPSRDIVIEIPDLQWQAVFAANGLAGIDSPQGTMGVQHFERGLMWAVTYQSGHMEPQFQPRVSYRHLQWVLGMIDSL